MKQIDNFVDSLYESVSGKEAKELKEEMRTHLLEAVHDLKKEGKSEEEAINIAIERFGDDSLRTKGRSKNSKYQRNFLKYLFRFAIITLLIAAISFLWVDKASDVYRQSMETAGLDIIAIADSDGNSVIDEKENEQIATVIEQFNEKYETLIYVSLFYEEEIDGKGPIEREVLIQDLKEAEYLFPENATEEPLHSGILSFGEKGWLVKMSFFDYQREKYHLIPIAFLTISIVLLIIYTIFKIYNRKTLKLN